MIKSIFFIIQWHQSILLTLRICAIKSVQNPRIVTFYAWNLFFRHISIKLNGTLWDTRGRSDEICFAQIRNLYARFNICIIELFTIKNSWKSILWNAITFVKNYFFAKKQWFCLFKWIVWFYLIFVKFFNFQLKI